MPTALIARLTHRLFGSPLLRNSIRGELVEEMVAQALEPDWALCADDWGACDLRQVANVPEDRPLRIQVKQSAARQNWHADGAPPSRPSFSIAHKTGRYEGHTWIAEPSRNAELFIFGWHPVTDPNADHRDPAQWLFFVMPERQLPSQAPIGLAGLHQLAEPVGINDLAKAVAHLVRPPSPATA